MPQAPFIAPERDEWFVRGRPKQGSTVYYAIPGAINSSNMSTAAPTANSDSYVPLFVETPIIVDQLAMEVTTAAAGQNVRFGLYRADRNLQPIGGPLADSGSVSLTATGVKTYTPGTPIFLQRGRYLSVVNYDGGSPAWRGVPSATASTYLSDALGSASLIRNMEASRAYAAFPTPGTAWTTVTLGASPSFHIVFYRISVP